MKELVQKQAAYLLVCHRQRLLSVPQAYAPRLLNISDAHEMSLKLREMVLGLLEELQHLPEQVTDEHWLEHIADGNGSPGEQGESPAKARTPRRRKAKAA